ncbi:LOW QUALITY PROTEIN: calcium-activated chloride channel regulator 1-like [Mya arenaria]|uniref:LOW QUALITY PROTEIN: calcium-activated chloride channel regulator 1-like n=1 Tax=Mya arenaria TaxID=6604 RepID=UPI0022E12B69|nr:LOW QUALITY PROTEIN: calcium-activated chloride channel regulator 1-like [Mya arenaria]
MYKLLFVVLSIGYSRSVSRPSTIVLENNQFKNVVVAVHDSIAEDGSLIDKIKDEMTEASKYIYKATRQQAYFKEITILLPNTWSSHASYGQATSETIQLADVIITDPIRGKRSLPQARSYEGCGKQGVHVLLTKEFFDNPSYEPYRNNSAKYFVHAFAQFRWGVFQEYSEEGEEVFYISFNSGYPEAIKCVYYLRGLIERNNAAVTTPCYITNSLDPVTGLYEKDCIWSPYPTRQRAKASIMDHQYITAIETFCDDDKADYMTVHNYEAPSKHNRLCEHRSTWDIVSNTDDFKDGKNPLVGLTDSLLTPTFKVVRASSRKKRTLVRFNPNLEESVTSGLITDIKRLQLELNSEEVEVIHKEETIPFGDEGSTLTVERHQVITTSHGKSSDTVYDIGQTLGHRHVDRMRQAVMQNDLYKDYVIVAQSEFNLVGRQPVESTVGIDETLAHHMTYMFYYDTDMPFVDLRSPSGVIYDIESDICAVDTDSKSIKFHFSFTEVGKWTYKIYQSSELSQRVQVTISSADENHSLDPLTVRPSSKLIQEDPPAMLLILDVTQGVHPVLGLNATVLIEGPDSLRTVLQLFDNGGGADVNKNDGVYSRYFTKISTGGVYHFTFKIKGYGEDVYQREQTYSVDNFDGPIKKIITKRSIRGRSKDTFMETLYFCRRGSTPYHQDFLCSRITDLRSVRSLRYRKSVILTWTAPGDEVDLDKSVSYELFVGYDIDDVRQFLQFTDTGVYNGKGIVQKEIIQTSSSGSTVEKALIMPKRQSRTLAFSIKVVDALGNTSRTSNVASALNPWR